MPAVLNERRGETLWIIINRPEKRNAINSDVLKGIADGYRMAEADPAIRAIVLTGAGESAFCAGADLQPGQAFTFDYDSPTAPFANLLRLARSAIVPTLARVNGTCMAGGMALLSMTDFAIATEDAIFGLPEVRVGLFPFQVVALLQELVPARIMREWCLSGEPLDADTALRAGLINRKISRARLDDEVRTFLQRILSKSPAAIRRGKYALGAMQHMSFPEALAFAESQLPLMASSKDAVEGLEAFNEKRKPVWGEQ